MKENRLKRKKAVHLRAPLLLALLLCSLASCGSVNESLCSLLRFRPGCTGDNCNASFVNPSVCGVKFDENGDVAFVSASRAATKYRTANSRAHVDTKHLSGLTTVKSLFLYESGLTTLDESIGSLGSLKHLYKKIAKGDTTFHSPTFIFFKYIQISLQKLTEGTSSEHRKS